MIENETSPFRSKLQKLRELDSRLFSMQLKVSTHFYRMREEGGSGRAPPPTVHLRTDDVTWIYYTSCERESSGDSDLD